ncbi:2,5-diketo-D-gluconate reductase B [Halanaerobium salsuginis]|jgi:diketogulonate reductase-like aldo/keto reductase|uniref:2,5-diketo-D-gluconate reductase B n=2 Tax=Halanaerobium salsuginis TaxID=29563 RepID=A0A1I4GPQ6_9FIRM|nr:2,5-diketo-D-gluconate reductase B [Halanaerobium salsuginis]
MLKLIEFINNKVNRKGVCLLMKNLKLKNGSEIPALGLGTSGLKSDQCTETVKTALELGYRHLDTAAAYGNQTAIARAIKESTIPRQELFITSKVWWTDLAYNDFKQAVEKILSELELDYLDMLLIHWPNSDIPLTETLKALQEVKAAGQAKNTGVSNFTINHLKKALSIAPELITDNQVEFHPTLYQKELLKFCFKNDIILTAYSPLARGEALHNSVIKNLADKYDKSPAQLTLKWLLEKDIVVIPKASSQKHLANNLEVFDWDLPLEAAREMELINNNNRVINPDFAEFN